MWPVTLVFQIETSLQLLHVMTEILFSAWNTLPTSEHKELLALSNGSLEHRPVLTHVIELPFYKGTDNIQTMNVYIYIQKVVKAHPIDKWLNLICSVLREHIFCSSAFKLLSWWLVSWNVCNFLCSNKITGNILFYVYNGKWVITLFLSIIYIGLHLITWGKCYLR